MHRNDEKVKDMSRQSAVGISFIGCGLLALLALVALAVQQRDQLSALREKNQSLQAGANEMERLRAENQEAHRLRNQETEIQQLRENWNFHENLSDGFYSRSRKNSIS